METQKTGTEIYDLSNDLMVEILSWLPLRSIARCLNVSKRWQSLIIDSQYLTNAINVAAAILNHPNRPRNLCLEKGQRGRMQQVPELDFCIDFPNKSLYDHWVLSSCNGLLFSYFFNRLEGHGYCYISNPWTKECVSIPNPTLSCQYYDLYPPFLRGFAFENNSRDKNNVALYKIVMAFIVVQALHDYNYTYNYKFKMYSSEKKRWELLEWVTQTHPSCHHRPQGICALQQNAVYCNRVLYWQCSREDHALMLNLETETSGYLDLPSDGDTTAFRHRLMACDGLLHYIRIGIGGRLSVWKMSMMRDEWLILHNVDLNKAVKRDLDSFSVYRGDIRNLKPIDMSCQGDDKLLFAYYSCPFQSYGRIVSYDLRRDVFEPVFPKDFLSDWMFFRYTPTKMSISER